VTNGVYLNVDYSVDGSMKDYQYIVQKELCEVDNVVAMVRELTNGIAGFNREFIIDSLVLIKLRIF
jgi:hypothetical protein